MFAAALRPAGAQPRPVPAARPLPYDSLWANTHRAGLPDSARVYQGLIACQFLMYASPDSSRAYVQRALRLAQRTGLRRGQAEAYGGLAGLHLYAHEYPAAQRTYQQQLRVGQAMGNPHFVGGACMGLASLAKRLGNAAAVEGYYRRAHAAFSAPPGDADGLLLLLHNQAEYYLDQHQPARAAPLVREGVARLNARTYPEVRVALLTQLGLVQARAQQPDSAAATWHRALALARPDHLDTQAATLHRLLADHYLAQHRPAQALAEARQGVALARRSGSLPLLVETLEPLAHALQALRLPGAYDSLARLMGLRDSLQAQENTAALAEAQARFQATEQQARIRSLEQTQRLARQAAELRRLLTQRQLVGGGTVAGLLLVLGAVAVRRYRRRAAARQYAHDTALRRQLAADLHDEVGGLLTQISLQGDFMHQGLHPPAEQQQRLARLAEAGRTAVRHMADVVWGLSDAGHAPTLGPLLLRLRDHAHDVLPPAGLEVDFYADPALAPLAVPAHIQQALHLIYKEALHNAVKHTHGATEVGIRLTRTSRTLHLQVQDDALTAAAGPQATGHGLRNMSARALAVGGSVAFSTRTGFGVMVTLPVG